MTTEKAIKEARLDLDLKLAIEEAAIEEPCSRSVFTEAFADCPDGWNQTNFLSNLASISFKPRRRGRRPASIGSVWDVHEHYAIHSPTEW